MLQYIKNELVARFDPDATFLHQALRTAISATIAIIFYHLFASYTQGYWLILSAAFIMQTRLGDTQSEHILYILLASLLSAFLGAVVGLFWANTLLLAIYLAITTFFAVFANNINLNTAITAFFINLFIIMSAGLPCEGSEWIERGVMIFFGGIIALVISFLWQQTKAQHFHSAVAVYYLGLQTLVVSFLQAFHKQSNEDVLHERRNRCLRFLNHIRLIAKLPSEQDKLKSAEHLYSTILALGNLRHRLTLADDDIKQAIIAILGEISDLLEAKAKFKTIEVKALTTAINHLALQINKLADLQQQNALLSFVYSCKIFAKEIA